MQGKIIPFGYANGGIPELERLMRDERAYLVDIRLSPRSGWQALNKEALQARFRSRYIHIPELGNVNYNARGQGIKLANPGQGVQRLINGLNQGYTLILMCGCLHYETCHRHTVVDLLHAAMPGVQVVMPDVASPGDTLKCLSIRQPWAWLITHPEIVAECGLPAKDIENRHWSTNYRGDLLIHAGTSVDSDLFTRGQLDYGYWEYKFGHAGAALYARMPQRKEDYSRGGVVGRVQLVDVVEASDSPWFNGPYGLVLFGATAMTLIACKGALKIFDISASLIREESSTC